MAATPAERMRSARTRRRAEGKREVRLILPDARTHEVRQRVQEAVAGLSQTNETNALAWIEAVADHDDAEAR